MIKITKIQNITRKNIEKTNFSNYLNFGSNQDNFVKNNQNEANKTNKKKKLIMAGILITSIISAITLILCNIYKNKKNDSSVEKLYDEIMSILNENPELKEKVEAKAKKLNLSKISDFADNNTRNMHALKSLEYLIAMDDLPEAQQKIKIPGLITFDKMDDRALFDMLNIIFSKSNIRTITIKYNGDIQSTLNKLRNLNELSTQKRTFVIIDNSNNKMFEKDIEKNKNAIQSLEDFFNSIKDKNITFVTSNPFLMKILRKMNNTPEKLNIGYKVTNLEKFMYNCIRKN